MPHDKQSFANYVQSGEVPLAPPSVRPALGGGGGHAALLPMAPSPPPDLPEEYCQNGFDAARLRDLRKSAPEDVLDMHELTINEARDALEHFLQRALDRRYRVIEIIHGRGLHSAGGAAPLRACTRYWLRHCKAALAYCHPPKNDGSTLALLKSARR